MTFPIVTTKLNTPPLRTDLVERHNIIERLNTGLRGKLTILSAPAGFGKTTTLVEWLDRLEISSAWLALDEQDNDVSRFLNYLISAFAAVDKNISTDALGMGLVPQAPSENALLSELINALAGYQGELVLVMDDYHLIENQNVHDLVGYFLENQPENVHLVIATRYDPPLPISRLRGRGQLMEIRSNDLRFTTKEIVEFLNELNGLELDPKNIELLEDRTEGWAVSLQLLALSLQGRLDKKDFVASFSGSHHYIVDYLVDEIMSNQPEEIKTFLYRTSILDQLCTPLADALVENADSKNMLWHLEKSNLFLIALDDERNWYRYHHLFVDYLRQQLKERHPEIITGLHRKAAEWYKNNGYVEEAIKHGLHAKDYEFVVDLVEENSDAFWWRGEYATLHKWIMSIPEEMVAARPKLNIGFAITYMMSGQSKEAEERLKDAEKALGGSTTEPSKSELKGMIAAIRASIAFLILGDIPKTIAYSNQALALLPEENAAWRCLAALDSGDAHSVAGDLETAKRDYLQAAAAGKQAGHLFLSMIASAKLANNYLVKGCLRSGAETVHQALEFAKDKGGMHSPRTALLFTILADILCEWNRLDEALENVEKGIELSKRANNILGAAWGYRTLTKILFSKGDLSKAQTAVENLENLTRTSNLPSYMISSLVTWKVRIEIANNRLEKAESTIQEYKIDSDEKISYNNFLRFFSLSRLLIAQKNYDEAENKLDRLLEITETWGYTNGLIEVLVLKSITLSAEGKEAQALVVLEDALSKAEPEGYVRIFVDEGEPMARLLHRLKAKGIFQEYVHTLLTAFDDTTGIKPLESKQSLIEPLSTREREILKLLTTELSVPEIADELVISANTVRTHTRKIYAKLAVNNRRSAVRKAKELELI